MAISAERVATRISNLEAAVESAAQAIETHKARLTTSQTRLEEAQAELNFWKGHPAAQNGSAG